MTFWRSSPSDPSSVSIPPFSSVYLSTKHSPSWDQSCCHGFCVALAATVNCFFFPLTSTHPSQLLTYRLCLSYLFLQQVGCSLEFNDLILLLVCRVQNQCDPWSLSLCSHAKFVLWSFFFLLLTHSIFYFTFCWNHTEPGFLCAHTIVITPCLIQLLSVSPQIQTSLCTSRLLFPASACAYLLCLRTLSCFPLSVETLGRLYNNHIFTLGLPILLEQVPLLRTKL